MTDTNQKNVYVVIGIGRSGTSAIASGLNALGIDFGNDLKPGDAVWNPKGFWEDIDIGHTINRGVVSVVDYNWMSMNSIHTLCHENPALQGLKNYAKDLLRKRMSNTTRWGFKDISTVKILPFWQEVFSELDVKDNYIITVRNPLATAHSYHRVDKNDIEIGLIVWLMHIIPAINDTQGRNKLVVSYDLMLESPRSQLERIQKQLKLSKPNDAALNEYVHDFLDKKLQHYHYTNEALKAHSAFAVAPLCLKTYELLMRLAKDEIKFTDQVFIDTWAEIKTEFAQVHAIYGYIEVLLKRNKELSRELRSVHKSVLWKMIYPLRIVDDWLRKRRRQSRNTKRLAQVLG